MDTDLVIRVVVVCAVAGYCIGHGYYWWSTIAGEHRVNFAWGHGGDLIVLVHDLDLVVVVTADPLWGKDLHFDSWPREKANLALAADFIASLPRGNKR